MQHDQQGSDAHPADFWAGVEVYRQIFHTKLCLAASKTDPCEGQIIRAHTIPRSQLQKIADSSHVYAVRATAEDLMRNEGKLTASKIGVSRFSVLNCFCAKHDRILFASIEDEPLVFDARQLTLLHYRAVGSELYKKMSSTVATLHQLDAYQKKARNKKTRAAIQFLESLAYGGKLGVRDTGAVFARCEDQLSSRRYDEVSALVLHFKQMPSIMTVGGFLPEFNYNGLPVQRLGNSNTIYQMVSFNILAAQGHAAVAMLWFKGDDLVKVFAESFVAQKPERYTTLAIQTSFEHIENTCMLPSWWEGLRQIERQILLQRMQTSGSPRNERKANCLTYGGVTFDQWDYDGHEFINT